MSQDDLIRPTRKVLEEGLSYLREVVSANDRPGREAAISIIVWAKRLLLWEPSSSMAKIPCPITPRQEEKFLEFHRKNPHVLDEVIRIARELKESGVTQGAIGLIWERLRRVDAVDVDRGAEEYELNNNFRSYYARLAEFRDPELEGYFELRSQRVPFDPSGVTP